MDCFVSSLDALWGAIDGVDLPVQIPRFEVPVFFFAGRHDWNTPQLLVEEWAGTLDAPKVDLVWFEDAGHMIPLESPAEFQHQLIERLLPLAGSVTI
jgi:pimeloyl-ACP methyl ester carboxylesterase